MNDLVTDGIQPADIERIREPFEVRQRMDLTHIQEIAKVLGKLMTSYANKHGGMPIVTQTNLITDNGKEVKLEVR